METIGKANEMCNPLVGYPLKYIGRSIDLVKIGFGEELSRKNLRGVEVHTYLFSLHLQCPFRIVKEGKILVGYNDLFVSSDGSISQVDLEIKESLIFDKRVNENLSFLVGEQVQSVVLSNTRDLEIKLNSYCIEVFITNSTDREDWRLFKPWKKEKHLVAFGNNIEWQ